VHAAGAVMKVLRRLQMRAALQGWGDEFRSAVGHIYDQLCNNPTTFGEPCYRLPALQLSVRTAAVRPLVVDFAVHDTLPLVFIKGIKPLRWPLF
jgi:hypothetical protein